MKPEDNNRNTSILVAFSRHIFLQKSLLQKNPAVLDVILSCEIFQWILDNHFKRQKFELVDKNIKIDQNNVFSFTFNSKSTESQLIVKCVWLETEQSLSFNLLERHSGSENLFSSDIPLIGDCSADDFIDKNTSNFKSTLFDKLHIEKNTSSKSPEKLHGGLQVSPDAPVFSFYRPPVYGPYGPDDDDDDLVNPPSGLVPRIRFDPVNPDDIGRRNDPVLPRREPPFFGPGSGSLMGPNHPFFRDRRNDQGRPQGPFFNDNSGFQNNSQGGNRHFGESTWVDRGQNNSSRLQEPDTQINHGFEQFGNSQNLTEGSNQEANNSDRLQGPQPVTGQVVNRINQNEVNQTTNPLETIPSNSQTSVTQQTNTSSLFGRRVNEPQEPNTQNVNPSTFFGSNVPK